MADDRKKITAKAEKLVRQGKLDQAISLYKQLVDKSPEDMNLKNKVGDLYSRNGQPDEATKLYGQIAEFYGTEGFYLKAIAMLKKINKLDPSQIDCYYRLADLYDKQGLKNDARSQYQQVADLYAKQGDGEKATEAFEKIVDLDPSNIKMVMRLAEMYGKAGQQDKANASFRRVGEELRSKGMHEEAVKIYSKALEIEADDGDLLALLGSALLEVGRAEEALDRARGGYSKNSKHVGLLSMMGEAYQKLGKGEMAQQAWSKCAEIEPDNERWRELSGGGEDAGAAVADGPPEPDPEPTAAEASSDIPDLSEMSGDYTMAELSGEWNAEDLGGDLAPDTEQAGTDSTPASTGEVDSDKEEFIVEHMTEAEVFIKYGLVEKAIENLEAIVGRYPDEAESLRRLKDLYLETGNKRKAAERCVDLARIAREHGDASKAMDLLAEARAHDPEVSMDGKPAEAPAVDTAADDVYSFGETEGDGSVPVEMGESGPPSTGVEIDFGEPAGDDAGAIDFSVDEEPAAAAAAIEFNMDEPAAAPADDAIDFDMGDEASPAAETPSDDGIEFFDEAIRAPEREPEAVPPEAEVSHADDSLFDQETNFLEDEDDSPLGTSGEIVASGLGDDDSLEAIFEDFKKGVEEQVDEEDSETHYNLGIAYLEMELTDEAISEFQIAAKDPGKFVDSCSNLGRCFRMKGMPKLGVKWYEKALGELDESAGQYLPVLYELGGAYEESGEVEKALEIYMDVYGLDADYRDVGDKLENLGE